MSTVFFIGLLNPNHNPDLNLALPHQPQYLCGLCDPSEHRQAAARRASTAEGRFVGVFWEGTDGAIYTSADGQTWRHEGDNAWKPVGHYRVAFGNGAWVAVGNGRLILGAVTLEIRLSNPRFSDGNFEMTIHWQPGRTYRIQASIDLVNWETLYSETATTSTSTMRLRSLRSAQYFRVVTP